jgi:riboflavin kinase / FMN adenylyltransferase
MVWQATHPQKIPLRNGCVAALGNFDGVHAGHQALLKQAKTQAEVLGLPLVVLTFWPHPRTVLRVGADFHTLQTLPERVASLHAQGVEGVAVLPFTPERAHQSPEAFIEEILEGWLNAKAVVVGENFRFGHKAQGTPALLAQHKAFTTHTVTLHGDEEGPHSSTRLRQARQPS